MGCDINLFVEVKESGKWINKKSNYSHSRNRHLFSILANVRNGYPPLDFISEPKGMPDDASEEAKKEANTFEYEGHSHSCLYLSELLLFDWDKKAEFKGIVEYAHYMIIKDTNEAPTRYSIKTTGLGVKLQDMKDIDESNPPTHVIYRWHETYASMSMDFYEITIPYLKTLGDPENVRIVFFFDN